MNEAQIAQIVEQVVSQMHKGSKGTSQYSQNHLLNGEIGGRGVHPTVEQAVDSAQRAFKDLHDCSLQDRERFIEALRVKTLEELETISQMAVQETGLGRTLDKIEKNRLVVEKTPGTEALTPTANTGDHGLTLTEYAPYGVIGSITPCTNPTETILNNGIGMLAAGNSVVFNTHPNAKRVSAYFIDKLNSAIEQVGGPSNPVSYTHLTLPTICSV